MAKKAVDTIIQKLSPKFDTYHFRDNGNLEWEENTKLYGIYCLKISE